MPPPPPKSWKRRKGVTLAELLISLAILGVIATFTIPKIIGSQQDAQRVSIFKEVYGTLNQALYNGVTTGNLYRTPNSGNNWTYFSNNLNFVKRCLPATSGCWTQPAPSGNNTEGGFILHNGATVAGFTNNSGVGFWQGQESIIIDWNGPLAPNVEGTDQMVLYMCMDSSYGMCSKTTQLYPGGGASTTLFNQIFTN